MIILLPLGLAAFGLYVLRRSIHLRRHGIFTFGTVTHVRLTGKVPTLVVSFKIARKRHVSFNAGGWTGVNISYPVGSPVPVLYDPRDPTSAVIYDFGFMWLMPLGFIAGGLFFAYLALTHPSR